MGSFAKSFCESPDGTFTLPDFIQFLCRFFFFKKLTYFFTLRKVRGRGYQIRHGVLFKEEGKGLRQWKTTLRIECTALVFGNSFDLVKSGTMAKMS